MTERLTLTEQAAIMEAVEKLRYGGIAEIECPDGKMTVKVQEVPIEKRAWIYA